jgi:hypothetical protein
MALIAAVVLVGLGLRLGRGDERASRAAGVAFLLTASYVGGAVISFATFAGLDWPVSGVLGPAQRSRLRSSCASSTRPF